MATDMKKVIAANLAEIRKKNGFSQAELAEKASITNEFVSRVERATCFPSIKTLTRIANALGVKLGVFFDDPEDMSAWEIEIEALVILMKNKRGKSIRKVYKLAEVMDE